MIFIEISFQAINESVALKDILTSISILISITVVYLGWKKNRSLVKRELSDKVRTGASELIAKLDRYSELLATLFLKTQDVYVETSEILLDAHDTLKARDFLWKELNRIRENTLLRIMEENIQSAYAKLFWYHPSIEQKYNFVMNALGSLENEMFNELIMISQRAVMSYTEKQEGYHSALLGNDLRGVELMVREKYQEKVLEVISPIKVFLSSLILSSDKDLLDHKRRKDMLNLLSS